MISWLDARAAFQGVKDVGQVIRLSFRAYYGALGQRPFAGHPVVDHLFDGVGVE